MINLFKKDEISEIISVGVNNVGLTQFVSNPESNKSAV